MPQSLRVLQLCLPVAVVVLVVAADLLRSWDAIELTSSNDDSPERVQYLALSPYGYCVHHVNGSSECRSFVSTLVPDTRRPAQSPSTAITRDPLPNLPLIDASSQGGQVLREALACWCQAQGELSWVSRGAKSVACLVILEMCKYTTALWASFAAMEIGLGFSALVLPSDLPGVSACRAFISYGSAVLGLLVVLEWWSYSSAYIDREYLAHLGLYWHHGASFHLATTALVLTLLSTAVTLRGSGDGGARNYAQLHAFSRDQRRQHDAQDPLSCPANYLV